MKLVIVKTDNMTEKISQELLDILVCPVTREELIYDEENNQLISKSAKLAYPIKDGIPIMLPEEAQEIT